MGLNEARLIIENYLHTGEMGNQHDFNHALRLASAFLKEYYTKLIFSPCNQNLGEEKEKCD